METTTQLLDLPTEVLMKIFDYVPNKVPLKFTGLDIYKIICKIEQNKFRLVIKDENLHDFKIILRSNRIFDEIFITRIWDFNEYTMVRLSELLTKHQKTVRKVTISFAALAEHNLIQLLNLLPELQEIVVDVSLWFVSCVPQQQLNKLSKVESFTSNIESSIMILELPENILKKLSFNSATHNVAPSLELLKSIFEKQKFIKDLTVNPKDIDQTLLHVMKLESLVLSSNDHLMEILKQQNILTSLVVRCEVNNQELSAIYEFCSKLVLIDINVQNVSSDLLRQLHNLRELKDLSLTVNKDSHIIDLSHVFLPKVERFRLFNSNCESFQTLAEIMPKNFPNLKHLTVSNVYCSTFSTLLKNEHLVTLNILEIKPNQSETSSIRNDRIKELSVGFVNSFSRDILRNIMIMNSFPNLKKLRLNKFIISDVDVLLDILKTFKQLSHLSVAGSNFSLVISNATFFSFLKIHKKNLEFFEFTSSERKSNKRFQQKSDLDSKLQKMMNMFSSQFSSIFIDGNKFIMQCDSAKWRD